MRKFLLLLVLLLLIGGAIYVWVFERDRVLSLLGEAKQEVKQVERELKGFTPARTPLEAVDKFRQATSKRDFATAATYCAGEYGQEMTRAAESAQALAVAIDNLREVMDAEDIKGDKSRVILRYLEPFPKTFTTEVQEKGPDRAVAVIKEDFPGPIQDVYKLDPLMIRVLVKNLPPSVELKSEGEGDQKQWKLNFLVVKELKPSVDRLIEKHAAYVKVLDQLREEIKKDPAKRSRLGDNLMSELVKLK
jgi:hypothetical protein